jgi:predicted Zn finger-like uncharacterized protein
MCNQSSSHDSLIPPERRARQLQYTSMSLITRCTACGTLFKVVADQLKISEGWVRCGQCATVFDAQSNLVEEPFQAAPAASPTSASTSAFASIDTPAASPVLATPEAAEQSLGSADALAMLERSIQPAHEMSITQQDLLDVIAARNGASLLPTPRSGTPSRLPEFPQDEGDFSPGRLRDPSDVDSEVGLSTTSWAESGHSRATDAPSDFMLNSVPISEEPTTLRGESGGLLVQPAASAITPSFVAQAQSAARWRSPWVRLGLALVLLTLLSGLALQIAVHERDHIAALRPDAKPWLDQLCAHVGCQIKPLQRIEAITVDASSFNRINKNNPQLEAITQSYKLALTLKNTGPVPVALPHVELSLQNAQDQPMLRRVLSPADLGASMAMASLAPAQDVSGSLTLQISTAQLAGQRIQGYRVLAFYP